MRFLVFELLPILYFALVNSGVGLERSVAGKQRSLDLQIMPLKLTCSNLGVNPKVSGAWRRSPWWGVQGDEAVHPKKKILQIFDKFRKKKLKIDHISKTNNRKKKSFMQKMRARSIQIYPANLATL